LSFIAFAVLLYLSRERATPQGNVDVVSLVRKVNKQNQEETKRMVDELAKEIRELARVIKEERQRKQKEQVSPRTQKKLETLEAKLKAIEEKEKTKREMEFQKALMKQYLQEISKQEVSQVSLVVEVEKKKEKSLKKKTVLHRVYIPTGSVVAGETMHVVPAPVERGILPLPPVLVKLTGEAYTANGFSVPLDDCYAVGKAQGDWNFIGGKEFARAEIQLTKLVCVLGNGKVVEKNINAYVIDEETGMEGLIGKKMDISGEQIAKFTALNTLSSFWSALAKSYTETTTTKEGYTFEKVTKPAKYALFSALSKSWDKFTKFYEQRLSKIYPVVLVPAKRKLEVVFLSGVDLGITEKELTKWGI